MSKPCSDPGFAPAVVGNSLIKSRGGACAGFLLRTLSSPQAAAPFLAIILLFCTFFCYENMAVTGDTQLPRPPFTAPCHVFTFRVHLDLSPCAHLCVCVRARASPPALASGSAWLPCSPFPAWCVKLLISPRSVS